MDSAGVIEHYVTSNEEIEKGVFVLSFSPVSPFHPGQILAVTLSPGDRAPRLYSICSGNREKEMSILFNVVPGGELTSKLAELKRGDSIYCSAPYGRFRIGDEPSVWIANGTGIAPFISKIASGGGDKAMLIQGGRESGSFYFSRLLKKVLGDRYVKCSTRESGEEYFSGRLTAYLSETKELPADYKYYLCGSSLMVVEARDILISKGIPFNNIVSEIYF